MDYKRYEVQPNHNTTSEFLYKLVEETVYDNGHRSKIDLDFFVNIHDAMVAKEHLELENRDEKPSE